MGERERNRGLADAPVFEETGSQPDASRREQARRQRKGRHAASRKMPDRPGFYTALLLGSIAVLVILLLVVAGRLARHEAFRRQYAADRAQTLASGVTVDGAAVGGYTRDKALALLASPTAPEAVSFEYRIHVGETTSTMTQADLPVGSNLTAVMDQAWSLGRRLELSTGETVDSPFSARASLRAQLQKEGYALSSMTGYDVTDISRYVDALAARVDRDPVDAALISMDFSHRDFTFSDDIPGLTLDRDGLIAEIARRLAAGETDADIEAPVVLKPAAVSRLRLKNIFGCLEVRNFATDTPGGDQQVRAAVTALNGAIIPSGQTVSMKGLLGESAAEDAAVNADRFATAMFSAGVCAGMRLIERAPLETADKKVRGLEAHLSGTQDLRLQNSSQTPLCVLCYYTPLNGRGTRGSVTLEIYGIMRQGGGTAELTAETTEVLPAGAPEYRVNTDLEPGTTLLRREASDGAKINTVLVRKVNGKVYSSDIICTAVYPPLGRLIEKGP